MTTKKKDTTQVPPTMLLRPMSEAARLIDQQIEKGKLLLGWSVTNQVEQQGLANQVRQWREYVTQLLQVLFTTSAEAEAFGFWGIPGFQIGDPFPRQVQRQKEGIDVCIQRLESLRKRLELFPEVNPVTSSPSMEHATTTTTEKPRVFVVHGQDSGAKNTVALFLQRLDLEPVILHEQPNSGMTIIEKFRKYSDVRHAVVLLTPDDIGASKNEPSKLQPRARQNVILELGYFLARLPQHAVTVLYVQGVERPSDIAGVLYVEIDPADGWKYQLARELKAAGLDVDMNKII